MMLSESQERMLMVLRPEQEKEAEAIFHKWGLDFAIVGKTTDDLRFRCMWNGEEVANLPIKELGDEAPEYDRPWVEPKKPAPCREMTCLRNDLAAAVMKMMGSPDMSHAAGSGSSMTT
jgi:phosphoribosylformylglycinamidine (FGAM) synthase-like enzyme